VEGDDEAHPWLPQRDLLGSGRFARELVVEVDDDGTATLRFGDGVHGRRPTPGTTLAARYRVGNGTDGNVGAGSIAHLVTPVGGVLEVWNPLPARGGAVPESLTQVRQFAPQAFRVPQRAVTEADYGEVSARRRDVQRARAAFRWTGSWHTAFVAPDRVGGDPDDPGFRGEIRDYLERFRMAGVDLAVRRPVFVPLLIEMTVCVEPGYFAPDVKRRLLEVFGRLEGAEGRHGFFHPDRWSFGDPVYLSQVYEAAMGVDGVSHVEVTALQRWDGSPGQALDTGVLEVAPHEIVRLDNDANFPENGKLALTMEGGL
jgi:predicted phage baseplate assembly protein